MKIFSLQSKKSLFYASTIIGLILNILSMFMVVKNSSFGALEYMIERTSRGFPLPIPTYSHGDIVNLNSVKFTQPYVFIPFIVNFIFWILVAFIILSLIKYFKYRKTSTNQPSATNQRPYQR